MWVAGNSFMQRGFTLLELMVVLVLASLLLGVVTPRLYAVFPGVELKTSAQQLAAILRQARSHSITRDEVVSVVYKEDSSIIELSSRSQPYRWPEAVQLELEHVRDPILTEHSDYPTQNFYPSGHADGRTWRVYSDAGEYRIDTHWLTGKVSIYE